MPVHVVTVVCDVDPDASTAAVATALLADPHVVTVRLGAGRSASVIRVDVDARSRADAVAAATGIVQRTAIGGVRLRSADAVLESERD